MTTKFLSDPQLEGMATRLLRRYDSPYGAVSSPPVPVERILEDVLVGIDENRVIEWRKGAIPTGGKVWHIMRLAWSVPGGIEVMLPETAEHYRRFE